MQFIIAYNASMNIDSLQILLDCLRLANFSDVAKERSVAPSSVSRVINGLEKELGFRLFQRSTRSLQATEAGLRYCDRVKSILEDLETARALATKDVEQPSGLLRVTAPVVFGQMYIVPLLPSILESYPELHIELLLNDAFRDIIEERIDLAIRLGTLQDSSAIARRLSDLSFNICASQDYLNKHGTPTAPQDIKGHQCLLFPRSGYNLNWLFKNSDGEIVEIVISGRCMITNSQSIRHCAQQGMGLALLPNWLIHDDLKTNKLVALFPDYQVSATDYDAAIWMMYPSREFLPLKTKIFIEYLQSHYTSK